MCGKTLVTRLSVKVLWECPDVTVKDLMQLTPCFDIFYMLLLLDECMFKEIWGILLLTTNLV